MQSFLEISLVISKKKLIIDGYMNVKIHRMSVCVFNVEHMGYPATTFSQHQ